jgi:membrane-associated phospholipid phosphatase
MAVNAPGPAGAPVSARAPGRPAAWTAADRLLFGYATFAGCLALLWGWRWGFRAWAAAAAGHAALWAALAYLRRVPLRGRSPGGFARDAFPLLAIPFLYWELERLALLFSAGYHDEVVLRWEAALLGQQWAMTLAGYAPWRLLSEFLHLAYAFYWVLIPVAGLALYLSGRVDGFRELVFTVLLTFFACYVVFIFWPVEGPYYRFPPVGPPHSEGVVRRVVEAVLGAGASRGAAFPSSHVAVAVATLRVAARWHRALFWTLLPLVAGLAVGTVYGRFHYAVDALAGVAAGAALAAVAPRLRALLGDAELRATPGAAFASKG